MNMFQGNLVFCFIVCILSCVDTGTTSAATKSWQYLAMAQLWPGTSCVLFGKENCSVPLGTHGWTIHGLWPSNDSAEQPENCNDSMTFKYNQIKVLRPQLNEQWPNFNKSGNPLYLWKHEWIKHGTCAYELPILQGELKYFNSTLQLHKTLDIFGALSRSNIHPSENKRYKLRDIYLAIVDKYHKHPQISCLKIKNKHYLDQIWQCYNKTLHLIDCPEVIPHGDGNTGRMENHPEQSELALSFQSEKKGYFIGCPRNGTVRYVPVPASQM
ncbi:hypothetical protein BsWGS_11019 [Bradybaena similaris]